MWKVLLASVLQSAAGGLSLIIEFCSVAWTEGGKPWKEVTSMEIATVCIIWPFKAFCWTSVKKAKCVLIYRLFDEMNLRWILVVTPGFSCRTKQRWKVSSLKSLACLKWKMLMYFPEMHFTFPESLFLVFSMCQVACLLVIVSISPYSIKLIFFHTITSNKVVVL